MHTSYSLYIGVHVHVTGYDSGKDSVGVVHVRVNGQSAIKINGRAFHFFPSSTKQKYGCIANFIYDGSFQAEKSASSEAN